MSNGSEDRGGEEGDRGGDGGDMEIVVEEVVVVVVETVVEEEGIMAEILEEAEQAKEVEEAEILREETMEEIAVATVLGEEWKSWRSGMRLAMTVVEEEETKLKSRLIVVFFRQRFPSSKNRGNT